MTDLTITEQVKIIEGQIKPLNGLMQKVQYMTEYFGNDPMFNKEALDIVRSNISKTLK